MAFWNKVKHRDFVDDPVNKGRRSIFVYLPKDWRQERLERCIYTPKLWFQEDFLNTAAKTFYIEASLPKLLHGHNAIGLKNNDLPLVVSKLQDILKELGIIVFARQILDTLPSQIAFGKNIDITSISYCDQMIGVLALFDDRFRSECHIIKPRGGGIELYYNSRASTFKVYDKLAEIKNNAKTLGERKFVEAHSKQGYGQKEVWTCELLRAELTLKGTDSIKKRLAPFCGGEVTFEKMFDEKISSRLLKNEVERIYCRPLSEFIFLSTLQAPIIDDFLNKNVKHLGKKLMIKEMVSRIQNVNGIKGVRKYYLQTYRSEQTFYNHSKMLNKLAREIDFSQFENNSAVKIHSYFLKQFGLDRSIQNKLF